VSKKHTVEWADAHESRKERRERAAARTQVKKDERRNREPRIQFDQFPPSKMPKGGWKTEESLRGPVRVNPHPHRASTRVLGAAYPFLGESGEIMQGAYIGENLLARSPFCYDPWEAYAAHLVKSHSMMFLGVKGSGKSMLAKSFSSRLARLGRHIAVPHDPNGEWGRVAEYVGGSTIKLGLGLGTQINLLDAGVRDPAMSRQSWRAHVLQDRRATVKAIIKQIRHSTDITEYEHTAIDDALEALMSRDTVTISDVHTVLREYETEEEQVRWAARAVAHTLRRLVHGDLAGMFDGESTVEFDARAPMMVVDTSRLRTVAPDMQALARLATTRWIHNATTGVNRAKRLIVHEEAAIALMNDVYGGVGLVSRVADEKVARHDGVASCYLLHGIADLDALGDAGSAVREQAMRLLAGCESRVTMQQSTGEVERTARTFGWNQTMSALVPRLKKGEGLWQIGQDRIAMVKNKLTPREFEIFNTDGAGGAR